MVAEEIEIVVTAKVEEALREFKKMLPEIKKQLGQAQQEFNKVDMKSIASKTQNVVQQVKQKIGELKSSNTDRVLQKQFEKASTSVMNYRQQLEQTKEQLRQVYAQMDVKQEKTWKQYTPDGIELGNKGIEPAVNKALGEDKEYQKLITQETKLNQKIQELNQKLQQAKQNYKSIGAEVGQTQAKQNIFTSMAGKVNNVLQTMKGKANGVSSTFNKLPTITAKINANIKQMGAGMKHGLGHILKYAGALFSLRGIYSILSNSASAWLNSQNAGAQQLKANIDYLKYSMGSALAPAIQFITKLMYNLLKAIQSVVYALFRVNIFANASSKAYGSMAGSAKKAKNETKALAGIHDELNNITNNDTESGSGSPAPSFDLSTIDYDMTSWIDKIKEKLAVLFKPITNAWATYGQPLINSISYAFTSVWELIKSIGKSFEEVWLNGTGEQTISFILQGLTSIFNVIGNIATAFTNAWNEGEKGTQIIQNIWNGFNNLLSIIVSVFQTFEEYTASQNFQNFANSVISIIETLSSWFEKITEKIKEIWENAGKETFEKLLEFGGKLVELISVVLDKLSPIVDYILNVITPVIEGIISMTRDIIDALIGVIDFLIGVFTGDWDTAWEGIKEIFSGIWNYMKDWVKTAIYAIKGIIEVAIGIIKTVWNTMWTAIKTIVVGIWNGITSAITTALNAIKTNISNVLNSIKSTWTNIWNGMKTTVSNIWNGIWRYN